MILQVRLTFWWSLKFKKLNSFIFLWNKVGQRNFNFVTWKIEKLRKLATGHSRNFLVTIGNLGYLKLVKSDMYPKFLEINLVVVVRHSACVCYELEIGLKLNVELHLLRRDDDRGRRVGARGAKGSARRLLEALRRKRERANWGRHKNHRTCKGNVKYIWWMLFYLIQGI